MSDFAVFEFISQAWALPWPGFFLSIILKGSLILLTAGLIARVARAASAATRHLIWSLALGALFLLPLASLCLPQYSWAVLPTEGPLPLGITEQLHWESSESNQVPVELVFQEQTDRAELWIEPVRTPASTETRWALSHLNLSKTILIIWLMGVFLLLFYMGIGVSRVWMIGRGLETIEDESWLGLVDDIIVERRVKRKVRLLENPVLATPVTFGFFRPIIMLPQEAHDWSYERKRHSLFHEISHIQRLDWVTHILARVVCALHWFNPLVWVASRRLALEAEHSCDDSVLENGSTASDYAQHLLQLAEYAHGNRNTHYAAVAMAGGTELSHRVDSILDPKRRRKSLNGARVVFLAILTLAALTPLAAVQPAKAEIPQNEPVTFALEPAPISPARIQQPPQPAPVITASLRANVTPIEVEPIRESADFNVEIMPMEDAQPLSLGQLETTPLIQLPQKNLSDKRPTPSAKTLQLSQPVSVETGVSRALSLPGLMAADKLSQTKREDLAPLVKALRSNNYSELEGAQLRWKGALKPLAQALEDPNPITRRIALWGMSQLRDVRARDYLIQFLEDPNPSVRQEAILAIGRRQKKVPIDPIHGKLHDPSPQVRYQAAILLAELGKGESLIHLGMALDDQNHRSKQRIEITFNQIALKTKTSELTKLLNHPVARVRANIADRLGKRRWQRSVQPLIQTLADKEPLVRERAAWALGAMHTTRATQPLLQMAERSTEHEMVRITALEALGKIRSQATTSRLIAFLNNPNWKLRKTAATILHTFPNARGALQQALSDPNEAVRSSARASLKNYPLVRYSQRSRWENTPARSYTDPQSGKNQ